MEFDDEDIGKTESRPGAELPRFLNNSTLKPFIFRDKDLEHFKPIACYKGNQKINGYEATVLAMTTYSECLNQRLIQINNKGILDHTV